MLADGGVTIICAGGGGIEALIDKDSASALPAICLLDATAIIAVAAGTIVPAAR